MSNQIVNFFSSVLVAICLRCEVIRIRPGKISNDFDLNLSGPRSLH